MQLGRYNLMRRIGAGGMAEVWKARFEGPQGFAKTVAIKKILPHLVQEGSFVEMFVAEAKLIAKLTHPNIVQLVDFARIEAPGTDRPDYFIAMEYVPGQHLGQILRRAGEMGRRIPPEVAIYIITEVSKALGYAHAEGAVLGNRAVVHQDISPSNILVSYTGAVKVADFGIANVVRALIPQQEGRVTGKVGYMSPEQARARKLDARSDIFSMGIVLTELMTGQRLFAGSSSAEILQKIVKFEFNEDDFADIPYEVRDVMRRALTIDKLDRYQQASEVEIELSAILDHGSHISARNALASLIQNLFPEEFDKEVAEETDDDDVFEEDRATTRQMTNPHTEPPEDDYDMPAGTQVVSELNVPAYQEPVPRVELSQSVSTSGSSGSSGAEVVKHDERTQTAQRRTDSTQILDRSIDDPPTLEPSSASDPMIRIREDDPTVLGPSPMSLLENSGANIGAVKPVPTGSAPRVTEERSRSGSHSGSHSGSITGFNDPPTAPVQAIVPPGSRADFPQTKESVFSARWAIVAFVGMLIVAALLLVYRNFIQNPEIAKVSPTATAALSPEPTGSIRTVVMETPKPTPVKTATPRATKTPRVTRTPRKSPRATPRKTPRPTPVRTANTPVPTPTKAVVTQFGYLTVNARPWAEIYVGNKRISRESVTRYRLKVGTHNLRFVNSVKGFSVRKTIRIKHNHETRIFVDVPANRVTVTP